MLAKFALDKAELIDLVVRIIGNKAPGTRESNLVLSFPSTASWQGRDV